MKNIFVPTDFSACATFATKAALDLAAYHDATVHLYTKIDIHYNWKNLSEIDKAGYPEYLQKIHNTELLLQEWKAKAKKRGIKVITNWSAGILVENIEDYTKLYNIDFIVMGSHGAGGKNDYFIGTNTQRVIRLLHIPVLVVKNDISKNKLNKVIFSSNFDPKEKVAFQYLLDFVRPFNPEIHLLQVNTSGWFGQPYTLAKSLMDDFKVMCGDLECKTHFYRDWSVDAGTRHLAEEIGADLISISNQIRHPMKRMFAGSNVEALVNHANAPVLSIDFEPA